MKYTIEQLKELRNNLANELDDDYEYDAYDTDRGFFKDETEYFFKHLKELEEDTKKFRLPKVEVTKPILEYIQRVLKCSSDDYVKKLVSSLIDDCE